MKVTLIGFETFDFETKDGRIDGTKLYYNSPLNSTDCCGQSSGSVFVSRNFLTQKNYKREELEKKVNQDIVVDFNAKGKLVDFEI
jgi:hypothetical protein